MLSTFTLLGMSSLSNTSNDELYKDGACDSFDDYCSSLSPVRNVHHANARPKWNEFISTRPQRPVESGAAGKSHANKFVVWHRLDDEFLAPTCIRWSVRCFERQCRQLNGIGTCCIAVWWRVEWSWKWFSSGISFVSNEKNSYQTLY